MATHENNLRLKEITPGDEDGTWGGSTNLNLDLIGDAWGHSEIEIPNDANQTVTMLDGVPSPIRALFVEFTSAVPLTEARTITLAPPSVSKMWYVKNSTIGTHSLIFKQGSGATVTVPNGQTVLIMTDGQGAVGSVFALTPQVNAADVTGLTGVLAGKLDSTVFDVDHNSSSGLHKRVTIISDNSTQPAVSVGTGRLFTKTVNGVTCLFFKNDSGSEIQFTAGDELNVDIPDTVLAPDAVNATTNVTANTYVQAKYYLGEVASPTITAGVLTLDLQAAQLFVVTVDQNITQVNFTNAPSAGGTVGGVFGVIFNNLGSWDFVGSVNATGWQITRVDGSDLSLKPEGLTNMVVTMYPQLGVMLVNKNFWDWEPTP